MYFVTTIGKYRNSEFFDDIRCVGYFSTVEDAKDVILNNYGDIRETNYQYALIESVHVGLYPHAERLFWYEWINGKYQEIPTPEHFKQMCNFSIG